MTSLKLAADTLLWQLILTLTLTLTLTLLTTTVNPNYCKKLNSLKHLVRTTVAELHN